MLHVRWQIHKLCFSMKDRAALLAFLLLLALSQSARTAFADNEVGWPRFNMANGETHCAGKAFAVRWYRNRTLLLLPLHILSPEGGYTHYVEPQDVAREVSSLDVLDLQQRAVLATSKQPLLKTGSTVGQNTGNLSDDLMAFELTNASRLKPFQFFNGLAPKGTRVVILSKYSESTSLEPERYKGTVVSAAPSGMVINMDSPMRALSSSGAPVVNAKNELVGMMVGTGDDARMVISAIPSSSLISRIFNEIGQ